MRNLELRVPPDVVAVLVIGAMWFLARLGGPLPLAPLPRYLLGTVFVLMGVFVVFAARKALAQHHTAWQPVDPSRASSLVSDGIYRFTRNPMYIGSWLFLLGLGVMFGSYFSAAGSLLFILYVDRFQIVPEERALSSRFGETFESYRRSVRRWV